jgi:hypothetical protein
MKPKTARAILYKNLTRKIKSKSKNNEYISLLKNIYPSCKFDSGKDNYSLYENHNITYGEMEYVGIDKLYNHVINLIPKCNFFIDIGSGRGKICMYMASKPKISKVLAIELVKERHDDAEDLKGKLKKYIFTNKVELINENIFNVNLKNNLNCFVWFSNLCFDSSNNNEVFKKLKNELPKGSIICCSKKFDNFEPLETIDIQMSWYKNKESTVYIYRL